MTNYYKSWLSNTLINHTLTLAPSAFFKKVLYVFALFFLTATSWGQSASQYAYTVGTETYAQITGTTSTASGDDGTQTNISIGFTFKFGGVDYTKFGISTNGIIRLGTNASTTTFSSAHINSFSTSNANIPLIAALWDDNNLSTGTIRYSLTGIAPNQVLTINWHNTKLGGAGSSSSSANSFLIRLYETSNVIELVYGATISSSNIVTASVGLNDLSSFLSLTPASSTPGSTFTSSFSSANNSISSIIMTSLGGKKITFTPPTPCSGTPTPGNTIASVNPVGGGSSTILSLQNLTTGSGVTYQWKSSIDNVTYTSISGATNATYTATPSAATYYVCDVTCSGVTTTSNPVQVTLIYCTPTSASSSTYHITGVTFTGGVNNFANTATGSGLLNSYSNYSSTISCSQYATGNINYTISLAGNASSNSYSYGLALWVDWNNNLVFETSERMYNSAAYIYSASGSFTVPSGTPLGNYRMRIVTDYNATSPSACTLTSGNGEIEDYTFTVVAQPTCMVTTTLTSSAISYQTATIGWTAPTSGTSPAGYEYEVRTSGAAGSGATGLVTSGSTTSPTVSANLTGLNGGTAYTYYVRSDCGGGDFSSWASATFTTLSCNVPTAVTSSAITTSTATIAWTAPATGSPAGYEYEIRTSGAAGSGATGLVASGTTTAPTVSASLNALSAATSYSVYVRTNCYSGFNSSWTSAVTFATLCNSVTTLPFTESFEGITTGIPTCWGIAGNLASSSSYHFSSTASGKTGRGLIFNSYNSSSGSTSELITPTLDLTSLSTAELKFWFKNPTGGNFEVLISIDNGANYTSLQSSLTGQTAWLQKSYTITSYISSTVKIKFKGTSNYGNGDAYVYLDEIMVQAIPSCLPVTSLTTSAITYQTATIGWTAPSSGTSPASYEYEVRTSGAAGSGATGLVTSGSTTSPTVSVNLTGLNGGTAYTYYVRSDCGGGDFSSWASATFTTLSCNVPTAVTSSAIATTTATIAWTAPATGSPTGYEYEVRTSGAAGSGATGLVTSGSTTAPTVSTSLTGLTASSSYSVYVRTNCYSGFNSSWTSAVNFSTLQIPATVPYSDDFSSNNYTFVNGTQTNKWAFGSATGNTGNSIYVSNDNGTSNAYSNSTSVVQAYRDIAIPVGASIAQFSFNWLGNGESGYDYTRVWLVPSSFVPSAGSQISSGSGRIQVGSNFNSQSTWQTYTNNTLDVSSFANTTMRLIFEWRNDSSGGSNPPGAIDNVSFSISNVWTGTTSNSWNTASNWSANAVPTASDDILIASDGSNAPMLDVDVTIPAGKSLTINGSGTLTIAPGKVLTIAGTANFNGKAVIFKSDATGAGMFGPLTGTLTGATNVKVERFIPARRAYRFLSPAVTTSTTIRQNWQEDGVNTAGFGTHITGATGASAGFDPTETNNSSLLIFTSGAWVGATNTNVSTLTAGNAYCLMVRGDRTTILTTNTPDTSNTVLRATGTLFTGNFTPALSAAASGYSFVGNPYQAPLDIKTALQSSTDVNKNVVYYWDPTINDRGGYITRNLQASENSPNNTSVNDYVQPGQAFFLVNEPTLTGTPALTFTENHKSVANAAAGVFRNANTSEYGTLRVNLQANKNNQWQTIEGALAIFNDNFSWNVTSEDATKLANLDEDVSFVQNNTSLAIACQSNPSTTSELPLKIERMRHSAYQWQFELDNYEGESAYLFDAVNNSFTAITHGTVVPFTADANTANRFKIVFQTSALSTDDFVKNIKLYPNPAKAGGSFYIDGIIEATVSVYNVVGQNIPVTVMSQGNAVQVTPKTALSQGVYLVTVTTAGKTAQVKWIVE